jgi:hypothetical protein
MKLDKRAKIFFIEGSLRLLQYITLKSRCFRDGRDNCSKKLTMASVINGGYSHQSMVST